MRVDGVVTDQGVDAGRGVPERAHLLLDGGLHFRQGLKHPVGGRHFEHAADVFGLVEFGAVGRQRQHADPFGELWVAGRNGGIPPGRR